MVKESEPELTDQEALDGLSQDTEEGDNRATSLSPLLQDQAIGNQSEPR
jgi:hypothetical protein